ncbi:glycoside hydrolase family 127 protein [Duganella sp. BJB1802]|uniref:glycoside hydrolase family 127 protein n=1 Tax=Duganella sp. BJB1802 TaxID=2744575 RepID=UPI001594D6AB|nr:glycoside hydrolase family 127 protein [Duganella sp. BJB1802]NVD69893.1 glycoside hydrolase family 127 protein [Duganella sp. BJB1802]
MTVMKAALRGAVALAAAAMLCTASAATTAAPLRLFPLADVRLGDSPFLDAQRTDLHYLLEMEPDRLLAPFLREAGLPLKQPSYGNWESSGLDGHLGGHYLSALALMYASTRDEEVLRRLNYFVAELKRCQERNGNGYIGGIPDGSAAWQAIAKGDLHADNFSVNGKWVPWYNLHKVYAGLRDAYTYAGNADARAMLIAMSDWALELTSHLSEEQMQSMLRSEHGGMNEVLADVAQMTGQKKYMDLAIRFSHQAILRPLEEGKDQLTGLHANTQIPKVIGFKRIGDITGRRDWQQAAQFFWQTVHDHRTVAIGGNSVKEHFHDDKDYSPMVEEVEGPETCNTYNMLKLTELLFLGDAKGSYTDYYERALYNHILSSQRPDSGGFVYFTPMRPNHYRVYSQVDKAMWCCVGSGIESHAKYGEFIYAHRGDQLYVNLFIPSTLNWREQGVTITQANRFPDEDRSTIVVKGAKAFTMKIRYPEWVARGALRITINGKPVAANAGADRYVNLRRQWRDGDKVEIRLPMKTHLEQMPDKSNYYAVLHGPIVLAARTNPFAGEKLNFFADDSRMGHVAQGQVCPLESAPMLVSDTKAFMDRFKPVPGKPLTFTAPGLVQGKNVDNVTFIPFFRLHDSRYVVYWPYSTPANLASMQAKAAQDEADRLALDALTIDQVAPGEQQPESDHFFKGEGADAGVNKGLHWRHASGWFSYDLTDKKAEARMLRLTYSTLDAGRRFDIFINGQPLAEVTLDATAPQEIYTKDYAIPPAMAAGGKLTVKFVARQGSMAGGLYGLRLLR